MTPTPDELRAAIEWGLHHLGYSDAEANKHATILRAHLETLDEERAFLEAAKKFAAIWLNTNMPPIGVAAQRIVDANRALVAKREKP